MSRMNPGAMPPGGYPQQAPGGHPSCPSSLPSRERSDRLPNAASPPAAPARCSSRSRQSRRRRYVQDPPREPASAARIGRWAAAGSRPRRARQRCDTQDPSVPSPNRWWLRWPYTTRNHPRAEERCEALGPHGCRMDAAAVCVKAKNMKAPSCLASRRLCGRGDCATLQSQLHARRVVSRPEGASLWSRPASHEACPEK